MTRAVWPLYAGIVYLCVVVHNQSEKIKQLEGYSLRHWDVIEKLDRELMDHAQRIQKLSR